MSNRFNNNFFFILLLKIYLYLHIIMALDVGLEFIKECFENVNEFTYENNLFSSIDKAKRRKKKYKLRKKPLIKHEVVNLENYIENSKYKYITIKLNSNLYFDISHCGYIYIDKNMFIPNTIFLGKFNVIQELKKRPKIQFYFNPNFKISKQKILLNNDIRIHLGDNLFNTLIETNKEFESCLNQKIPIQFCCFDYEYRIKYILNKHEIGIIIYNKKNEDCTNFFINYRKEINTWVIHTLEKYDKDFYIDRLKYVLKKRELELKKLKKKASFI